MFDSLDEQIRHDAEETSTRTQRWLKYAAITVTSLLLFAGLYFAVRLLE